MSFDGALVALLTSKLQVRYAVEEEHVVTRNGSGRIETETIAQPGCTIFRDLQNIRDQYVQRDENGECWTKEIVQLKGYKFERDGQDGSVIMLRTEQAEFLVGSLRGPSVLIDIFGPGEHQYLDENDVLKRSADGRVTGLQLEAFKRNWTIRNAS